MQTAITDVNASDSVIPVFDDGESVLDQLNFVNNCILLMEMSCECHDDIKIPIISNESYIIIPFIIYDMILCIYFESFCISKT